MSKSLFQRIAAVSLSAVLTLTMLGSIDQLAQRDDAAAAPMSLQRAAVPARG